MNRLFRYWGLVAVALVLVLWSNPAHAAKIVKGKIKQVHPDKNQIVVTDTEGKDHLIHLSQQTKTRLASAINDNDDWLPRRSQLTMRQRLGLDEIEDETICLAPWAKPMPKEPNKPSIALAQLTGTYISEAKSLPQKKIEVQGFQIGDVVVVSCREKEKIVMATEIFMNK